MDADSIEKKTETTYLLVLGLTTSLILLYRKHHTTAIFYNIVGKTKLIGEPEDFLLPFSEPNMLGAHKKTSALDKQIMAKKKWHA